MEVEVRTMEPRTKNKFTTMLTQFKADVATLRKDFDRVKVDENRDYLFDVGKDSASVHTAAQFFVVHVPCNSGPF